MDLEKESDTALFALDTQKSEEWYIFAERSFEGIGKDSKYVL